MIRLLLLPYFFPHLIFYRRPCSLSLLAVAQIRGLVADSSRPPSTTVRALHFYREKIPALSSLVGKRRIVLAHAINRRSQQIVDPFLIFANKFQVSPRRDSNSRTNTTKGGSIRGLPLLILNRRPRRPYSGDTYLVYRTWQLLMVQ